MRFLLRGPNLIAACLILGAISPGQTSTPAHKPATWKRYCQPDGGFCFKYPTSWLMLGDIFAGNGVVVAPPQKQVRELWDEITVTMVAPPPEGDEEGPGLDGVIEQATTGMREAGQSFETLQRQQRTVNNKPAEMLKATYREKATDRTWIEELVFIQGPENEIYSVALKCAPQNLARLEPVFSGVLASWTLPEPAPPADATDDEPAPHGATSAKPAPAESPH